MNNITKRKKGSGGAREGAGRRRYDGRCHVYKVADDAHEYIKRHGGGELITNLVRDAMAEQGEPK